MKYVDFKLIAKRYKNKTNNDFDYIFPKKIYTIPSYYNDSKNIQLPYGYVNYKVSEHQLIFIRKVSHDSLWIFFMTSFVFTLTNIFMGLGFGLFFYLLIIPLYICLLYSFMNVIVYPEKKVIFDRLKGTITYPRIIRWGYETTSFEKYVFRICGKPPYNYWLEINDEKNNRGFIIPIKKEIFQDDCIKMLDTISFIVWYMDKNRPLPPGKLFDAYREKDLARYREEGSEEPLYEEDLLVEPYREVQREYDRLILNQLTQISPDCTD